MPPSVSARKVGGRRLYELARAGTPVVAPPKEISVDRFELHPTSIPGAFDFEAVVSSGTYIRGLARDLGRALGCGGALETLSRTRIGPMELSAAVRLPDNGPDRGWIRGSGVPLEQMPLDLPVVELLEGEQVRGFALGQSVRPPGPDSEAAEVRVLDARGALLGIGEWRDGLVHPRVVLGAASDRGLPAFDPLC